MTIDYITKLTQEFISESIRDHEPKGLCLSTSIPLQIYLATKKIESDLIKGEVSTTKVDGTIQKVSHYWLQITSEDIIIDATIKQFNNLEPIYVGSIQDNEITKTYVRSKLDLHKWFEADFAIWKLPYEDITYSLDFPFIRGSVLYTLKLATILHSEIKQSNYLNDFINRQFGLYFRPIYFFLYHWHSKMINFEIREEFMPNGFDNLLADALQWEEGERLKFC